MEKNQSQENENENATIDADVACGIEILKSASITFAQHIYHITYIHPQLNATFDRHNARTAAMVGNNFRLVLCLLIVR